MSNRTILAFAVVMAICGALGYVAWTGKSPSDGGAVSPESQGQTAGHTGASSAAASAEKSTAASAKPLFDGWDKPAVAILFSGEMHGYIEPCGCSLHQLGGLSRRADLLRQMEKRGWL